MLTPTKFTTFEVYLKFMETGCFLVLFKPFWLIGKKNNNKTLTCAF